MNSQIRILALNALDSSTDEKDYPNKFAELFTTECVEIIYDAVKDGKERFEQAHQLLQRHFGVIHSFKQGQSITDMAPIVSKLVSYNFLVIMQS
jgi:hypothetical protein